MTRVTRSSGLYLPSVFVDFFLRGKMISIHVFAALLHSVLFLSYRCRSLSSWFVVVLMTTVRLHLMLFFFFTGPIHANIHMYMIYVYTSRHFFFPVFVVLLTVNKTATNKAVKTLHLIDSVNPSLKVRNAPHPPPPTL